MHETDAAGVLFFASQFKLVHDAYEAFLEQGGLPLVSLLNEKDFLLPIIHAESDFDIPLKVGDKISVRLRVKRKGTTSFILAHEIYKDNTRAGGGETVHVSISRKSGKKIPLPDKLLEVLK